MNEDQDHFHLELREHFAKKLDPQLGRARKAFSRQNRRPLRPRFVAWSIGAMAAAAAVIVMVWPVAKLVPAPHQSEIAQANAAPVVYQSAWQTIDDGTVYLSEDVPMRSIRRMQVDLVRWVDPSTQATIELTVPHEEVELVPLNTY